MVLQNLVAGGRAWTAEVGRSADVGVWHAPGELVEAIAESIAVIPVDCPATAAPRASVLPIWDRRGDLAPVSAALEDGLGFVVIRGFPGARIARERMPLVYWLLGQLLGQPIEQNVQGTLLYDVRDTGQDVRHGARFSVTNAESTFHTDNSFGDSIADYVGLLCLNPARSGGLSQLVSGYSVHDRLREQSPELLAELYRPFHVERRGGVREGESPTARVPVFAEHDGGLLCRYLRYWIHSGQERVGATLRSEQVAALDALDGTLADPRLRVEFTLQRDDIQFLNNRWLFHNRTAFEDYTEPDRRRYLMRLWIRRSGVAAQRGASTGVSASDRR